MRPQQVLSTKLEDWCEALRDHPDRDFVAYILSGIAAGFKIGVEREVRMLRARRNLPSTKAHAEVVEAYLEKEVAVGRIKRVLDEPIIHISPFGVIPKKEKGKWRLIVDLSHPDDHSVNDGICRDRSSLAYVSIDNLAEVVLALGRGCFLGKCDVRSAYRNIPVHPDDWRFLGLRWKGNVYVDTALPFGLRSAPKIFSAVADAFQWALTQGGVSLVCHYIDDFAVLGKTEQECGTALGKVLDLGSRLGLPMEPAKTVGPVTSLTFLGVEIDTVKLELRLPEVKIQELKSLLAQWLGKGRWCVKRELESLAGKLQQACKVVRPGRCFLRHLYVATAGPRPQSAPIRVNRAIRADIRWWHTFLQQWNGVSLLWNCGKQEPDEEIYTDASGSWGCGGHWRTRWFSIPWNGPSGTPQWVLGLQREDSIAVRELLPIVIAAVVWGRAWQGKLIRFHSDNVAVVGAIGRRYSSKRVMMHLLRCLVFFAAKHSFWFCAEHLPGRHNQRADALSRDRVDEFLSLSPQGVDAGGATLPSDIRDTLMDVQGEWISEHWTQQFGDSTRQL